MKRLILAFLLSLALAAGAQTTVTTSGANAPTRLGVTGANFGAAPPASDVAPNASTFKGANAYPQAATNTTGAGTKLCAGIGRRLFTIVDYSLIDAIDTATVTVDGSATVKTAGGTDWTAATSNAATATSLASALNSVSGLTAYAVGDSVYVQPAVATCTLTLATSMTAGEGTATSGTDGTVTLGGTPAFGTPVPPSSGGTGIVNNDAATFTRSGNHALTITTSGAADLNIGTGGTLGTAAYTAATAYATSAQGATADTAVQPGGALGTPSSGVATNLTGTATGLTSGAVSNSSLSTYAAYATLPGVVGNYASTPDSAAASVAGDIDIRIDVSMTDWTPSENKYLVNKGTSVGDRGYRLQVKTDGTLLLNTSADGTTQITATSTAATGITDGSRSCIRATRDVNNGAAGNDTIFYLASDYPACATWVQLGTTVTNAGTTSIFDNVQPLEVGMISVGGFEGPVAGKVYRAQVYDGIAGTLVADFNPSVSVAGASAFVAATGETWTINTSGANVARLLGNVVAQAVEGGAFALRATAALTNGAGAQAATITNGPVAGNPTKWIAIDDAGTTRYIPAW